VFADSLGPEDEVAIEATCNTHALVRAITPRVARVVVSNPMKTRAIAEAKVKTDKLACACGPPGSNEMLAVVRRARSPCR
jgi:hypothetical protein